MTAMLGDDQETERYRWLWAAALSLANTAELFPPPLAAPAPFPCPPGRSCFEQETEEGEPDTIEEEMPVGSADGDAETDNELWVLLVNPASEGFFAILHFFWQKVKRPD